MKVPRLLEKKKYIIPPPPEPIEKLTLKNALAKDISKLISTLVKQKEAEDHKKDYWLSFIEKANKTERELIKIAREIFGDQEAEVLRNLDNQKAIKGKETQFLPKLAAMNVIWLAKFLPFVKELITKIGADKLEEVKVGGQIQLTTPAMTSFFKYKVAALVKNINKTTRKQLAKELADGFAQGESIPNLKKRVQKVFGHADKVRATNIARTETIRISNFAANQAYIQSGVVTAKEWLTTKDGRQDFACDELDGKIVEINKPFVRVGDTITGEGQEMNIEVENVGYPPLHPGCRCTLIPVVL